MVLEHLFIWKASEPKKKPVGNSVKKIPWRKVYTFFKSPWVNNEPSKAKENVNKCHSKKALQRAKIRKKCDIKVWLWTSFGGGGFMSMKRKSCRLIIYWSFAILLNFFLIFFSLNVRYKKGCCLHIHTEGPSQFSLFSLFSSPFPKHIRTCLEY